VLAVKDERLGSARRLRRSSILDRCARREPRESGNPAQKIPRIAVMNDITLPLVYTPKHIRRSVPRRIPPIESGADLLQPNASLSAEEAQVLAQARAILLRIAGKSGVSLSAPCATREYLKTLLAPQERELFLVLALDNRHRVIASEILFAGTIDGASVHPREVVKCVRLATQRGRGDLFAQPSKRSGRAEPGG
jgi:hypothetical protein